VFDTRTCHTVERPVLSAVIPRSAMPQTVTTLLIFNRLDSSEAMEMFPHRGDFKASRKAGAFQPITPLIPADISQQTIEDMGFHDLLAKIQKMREELKSSIAELARRAYATMPQTGYSL